MCELEEEEEEAEEVRSARFGNIEKRVALFGDSEAARSVWMPQDLARLHT